MAVAAVVRDVMDNFIELSHVITGLIALIHLSPI